MCVIFAKVMPNEELEHLHPPPSRLQHISELEPISNTDHQQPLLKLMPPTVDCTAIPNDNDNNIVINDFNGTAGQQLSGQYSPMYPVSQVQRFIKLLKSIETFLCVLDGNQISQRAKGRAVRHLSVAGSWSRLSRADLRTNGWRPSSSSPSASDANSRRVLFVFRRTSADRIFAANVPWCTFSSGTSATWWRTSRPRANSLCSCGACHWGGQRRHCGWAATAAAAVHHISNGIPISVQW